MHRIVYISEATRPLTRPELNQIIVTSRRNNAREDLTGLLLYHQQRFFQVLEGPTRTLQTCLARIAGDNRHHGIQIIDRAAASERAFPQWQMGLAEPAELDSLARQSAFAIYDLIPPNSVNRGLDPRVRTRVRDFLAAFRHLRRPDPG